MKSKQRFAKFDKLWGDLKVVCKILKSNENLENTSLLSLEGTRTFPIFIRRNGVF